VSIDGSCQVLKDQWQLKRTYLGAVSLWQSTDEVMRICHLCSGLHLHQNTAQAAQQTATICMTAYQTVHAVTMYHRVSEVLQVAQHHEQKKT
jgi:hypothetical protein